MFLVPIVIYLVLCFAVGLWGRKAQIGFTGSFLLSVFLTPFVVFIATLLLAPRRGERVATRP